MLIKQFSYHKLHRLIIDKFIKFIKIITHYTDKILGMVCAWYKSLITDDGVIAGLHFI